MKTFFFPVINGYYNDAAVVQMDNKSWQEVRALALEIYSEEYVSNMMDGRGYIEIKTTGGKFRYVQED